MPSRRHGIAHRADEDLGPELHVVAGAEQEPHDVDHLIDTQEILRFGTRDDIAHLGVDEARTDHPRFDPVVMVAVLDYLAEGTQRVLADAVGSETGDNCHSRLAADVDDPPERALLHLR